LLTFKRHETAASCTFDQPLRFPFLDQFASIIPPANRQRTVGVENMKRVWDTSYPDHSQVSQIMGDLQAFNALLFREREWSVSRISAEAMASGFCLSSMVRRLLRLRSVGDSEEAASPFCEAFRLGGLLFLADIRRRFGAYPVMVLIYIRKVKSLLENHQSDWEAFAPLKIWTLVMAILEAEASPDKDWLVRELTETLKALHLTTYEGLKDLLEGFYWFPKVHEERFQIMWDTITQFLLQETPVIS
jgi:hypothetical protein